VSVGCRLPGGIRDLAGLRAVLDRAESVLQPVPADRWRYAPEAGAPAADQVGAFLPDIRRFDAEFFGISPREAREMDPQQRILLEVAAEALEASGRPLGQWVGSRTGVFTGVLASDYWLLHSKTRGTAEIDPFYATGKEFSFGAGRIAYSFDLHGPVLTVTTACSSSLLAVHLACQSLRNGECDTALAGGVNVLLAPELTLFMSRVGALSPTGRSMPFAADADGVVRGEGCALVALERLDDAERAGHPVLAVIDGSAVNHDGHSAGLTVPSTEAQVRLIRQVLASTGIPAREIGYVEAHATGTPLGDPIELAALSQVYGKAADRTEPLLVGSHKAVFGHLDSAAGILGLLKGICVVADGQVPAQPMLAELTLGFEWPDAGLRIATAPTPLPVAGTVRRAGVSAFGLSGTNVHVVLSQPPASAPSAPAEYRPREWGGSAYWLAGVQPGEQGPAAADATRDAAAAVPAERAAAPAERAAVASEQPAVSVSQSPANPGSAAQPAGTQVLAEVRDRVQDAVRQVLGLDEGAPVPARQPLLEQGLTSVTVVELAARLAEGFGTPEDPTLVYLYPCVDDIVEHFAAASMPAGSEPAAAAPAEPAPAEPELAAPESAAAEPAPMAAASGSEAEASPLQSTPAEPASLRQPAIPSAPAAVQPPADAALAIVGMACRFPGAGSLDEFWSLLQEGSGAVRELPEHRRQRDGWTGLPTGVPTRGGYLDGIEAFDAAYFRISPMEAERIDPQQRLFLEVATEALSDAGLRTETELAGRTGVFVGMNTTDYQQRLTRTPADVDVYYGTGNCFAGAPGRLAYVLDLGGPCLAVDTACSSALTALHLARQALRSGDCDAAVVGGVNVISGPTVSISMSRGGALSADGRCKTFAASADGYGRGEGAGVVVLKRLPDAVRDGDRIYATVLGSAANSDGASGGFTVPNAAAQVAVITAALAAAGLDPAEVGYVEAHGTGTPLGDPIELQALSKALSRTSSVPSSEEPYVGSVKSLIGHLEAAAGVAGLIKAALMVARGQILPHLVDGPVTQKVDWSRLGLRLPETGAAWPARQRRVAGISAFGFTGSNAHVVLGQAPVVQAPEATEPTDGLALLVSAESPAALRARAGQLRAVLASGARLPDLAYTLGMRTDTHRWRAVVLASDAADADAALAALAEDRAHPSLVQGSRAVSEPADLELRFGLGGYLGPDWAYLPDPLRLAANDAAAEVDRVLTAVRRELSTTQRQRVVSLRAQVGWVAIWRRLGLRIARTCGAGVGEQTAAWMRGEIELTAAVQRALEGVGDVRACDGEPSEAFVAWDVVPCGPTTFAAWQHVRARLHVAGYPVDFAGLVPTTGRLVPMPAYPWQHRDFWFDPSVPIGSDTVGQPATAEAAGPSAGRPDVSADPDAARPATESGQLRRLLFQHDWRPSLAEATKAATASGSWLIFADAADPAAGMPAEELADSLRDAGARASVVPLPAQEPDWMAALTGAGGPVAGAVLVAAGRADADELCLRFGQAVQRFPGAIRGAHLITAGAHDGTDPAQAAAWSVGSVLAAELGRRWGRLLDLGAEGSGPAAAAVVAALTDPAADDQLRWVDSGWQARRIRQYEGPLPQAPVVLDDAGCYAVHAADGPTADLLLGWLAERGGRRVLLHLASGEPAPAGSPDLAVDAVSDPAEWLARLEQLADTGTLAGLCYSAAEQTSPVTVREEIVPDSLSVTDDLLAGLVGVIGERPPGLVLLLTDAAGDWGAVGAAVAGARAARRRVLIESTEPLRERARMLGLLPFEHPSTAANTSSLQAESGIGTLTAPQLAMVLDVAVTGSTEPGVLSAGVVDVPRYVAVCQRLAPRALLTELDAEAGAGTGSGSGGTLSAELAALTESRRAERVLELVLTATGAALGLTANEVAPDTGFFDLGMDSIIALALKTQLEDAIGIELPATLTFELPTPRKLARHLTGLLETDAGDAAKGAPSADQRIGDPAGAGQPSTTIAESPRPSTTVAESPQPNATVAESLRPITATEFSAAAATPQSDLTAATDDELLQLLSAATASAQKLLEEAPPW